MSPVAQGGSHVGRAALVSFVGVVLAFAGLGLATWALRDTKSPDLRLGDQTFQAGNARRLAANIAEDGPAFFSDVSGQKDRDIILQHLGTDYRKGWHAFLAAPPDKPRDCTWQWQRPERRFQAKCDRSRTAPADGAGLPRFTVTVADGTVTVDLNADARRRDASTGD